MYIEANFHVGIRIGIGIADVQSSCNFQAQRIKRVISTGMHICLQVKYIWLQLTNTQFLFWVGTFKFQLQSLWIYMSMTRTVEGVTKHFRFFLSLAHVRGVILMSEGCSMSIWRKKIWHVWENEGHNDIFFLISS